ncbi:MAG: ABC-F family ATP-binding cassette domain-containing protein [Anaerolineaceae bacterium]|nr:ABC-F family ATP-binding cassette domain-containing protein [Anaerolineaceae bacterium]
MSLLTASGLSKSYGPEDIFRDLSFAIPQRARIGLVGANGVGKTTLLKVLVGLEEASAGDVRVARGIRVGYLPQRPNLDTHRSIWEECLGAFGDLIEMQAELHQLEHTMSAGHDPDTLERYGRLQHLFELRGGYAYETRIRQTLAGLGFDPADYHRPLNQISGGQQTRAFLARLLLTDPDLLLLDEPTNHLDISAIEWLEKYFKDWPGAALIVSHDRYFLDQVVEETWEMTPGLESYRGNYSAYLRQREERYRRRLEEYEAQQAFIEKEDEYIRRNMAGQNTRQAQGRLKRLERLLETAVITPPVDSRHLRFRLTPALRSGDLVLRTYDLGVGYQDEGRVLFTVPNLVLRRGECAAIMGPNGAGKTTFLKTILELIPPLQGRTELGANLNVGYFAQAHEGLHGNNTLIQEIETAAPNMRVGEIRDYLAKFLFTGEDVFKTVGMLSGGERGRLALAVLALSSANLLLLDEPTNHLDLPSQEVLQAVLSNYHGTILLVSHDRYLIDALGTQIWEVLPEEATLRIFDGDYSEYKQMLAAEAAREAALRETAPRPAARPSEDAPRPSGPSTNKQRQRLQQIKHLEDEIAALEAKLASIEKALENPPTDPAKVQKMGQDYLHAQQLLDQKMNQWAEMVE